jgi:translation elongation factor EF-1alpha
MKEFREVGKVAHFFTKINVAVIDVTDSLSVGDQIFIKGPTTDVEQTIDSMEIEHEKVKQAMAGQSVGMKVNGKVRESDVVYKTA